MDLQIFSTCPQSKDHAPDEYLDRVIEVSRWSEQFGCTGMLVYTDNGIVDPWHVAQVVIEHTDKLAPLVAVQPVYMHPYTVAKKIATMAYLYGRRMWINMVAGGFRNDLLALNDQTPHDDRYVRLVEYTTIVKRLLESDKGVTFKGRYYTVENLKLTPQVPAKLRPGITSSGSSEAGMQAAVDIGAVAVRYPKPPTEEQGVPADTPVPVGVRVGIVARATTEEAWAVALERFPEDRKGQLTHQLAMKTSDSQWHKQLSERREEEGRDPYWLGPFHNYKTFCPYLVGSYDEVGALLGGYIESGFQTFILDIPPSYEELKHTGSVFARALGYDQVVGQA